jgi:hypothetical protein
MFTTPGPPLSLCIPVFLAATFVTYLFGRKWADVNRREICVSAEDCDSGTSGIMPHKKSGPMEEQCVWSIGPVMYYRIGESTVNERRCYVFVPAMRPTQLKITTWVLSMCFFIATVYVLTFAYEVFILHYHFH